MPTRAYERARQLGDLAAEAAELRNLGVFIGHHGEPEQGRQMISEALAISERLGDVYHIGKAHQFLAWIDESDGSRSGTVAHYREALRCFEQVPSPDAEKMLASLRALGTDIVVERPFRPEVVRAMQAFLNTSSLPETRAALEREQALLLTDEADQFLGALIEQAQHSAAPDT